MSITHTPTAPLPTPALTLAANVYRVASARTAELSAVTDSRDLTPGESDYLAHAQDMLAAAKATLVSAGRLDLVEVTA